MTIRRDRPVDLRRAAVGELRAIDFRAPGRDDWQDESAVHDRFAAVWAGLARLRAAIEAMTIDGWLDPEGFGWAYEDFHRHVRAHHPMIGPSAARLGWATADGSR